MNAKRLLTAAAVCALCAAGMTTVTAHAEESSDVLSVVCWTDNDLKNMIDSYTKDYPEMTDKVKWVQCGKFGSDASVQYASFLNSGEDVDLFIAESGWILNYINNDKFSAPLSELNLTEEDYKNAYQYTVDIGTDKNGVLKGASWQATPGGFCYNTELAEKYLGVKTPEEMQKKISSWDKFTATAEELKQATDGTIKMTATLEGMWQCFNSAANAPWIIDGKVNTQTIRDFSGIAIDFVQNDYVDPYVTQWSTSWKNAGKNEETLGYFYSTWCLTSGTQLEENCGTDGNWNLVIGPQEYFWGGSWLCLSPNCNNMEEAERFVRYFTVDEDSMERYALSSGDFVNNQAVMEKIAAGDYQNPLLGGQNQFAVLKDVAANIKLNESITEYDQDLKESLTYALTSWSDYDDVDALVEEFLFAAEEKHPELFQEAPPAVKKAGDATGDGEVDILDVITMNKAIMGKETLEEAYLANIDFNKNQKPDADEASKILKYIVGLITESEMTA